MMPFFVSLCLCGVPAWQGSCAIFRKSVRDFAQVVWMQSARGFPPTYNSCLFIAVKKLNTQTGW